MRNKKVLNKSYRKSTKNNNTPQRKKKRVFSNSIEEEVYVACFLFFLLSGIRSTRRVTNKIFRASNEDRTRNIMGSNLIELDLGN